ncbi:putative ferrochelatase [Marmoricola endophyticus]|uniref:Coproporphyrin III ferrochelatase n=1 Tax=Marmoricola endophyticus TaxID=2040280 RepID=A0A917BAY5_9ACTN|nr:ferrochelatase [Marmoricola endophyticus]GGF32717.1 putative ferrochelatase [Marmoricola endophyticus]
MPLSDATTVPDTSPYDALLLVSFGGPEKPADVVPFLRNVTAGRDIPDSRLEEVGEHYYQFGGRSPINGQNRALLAAIREDLAAAGIDLPVYWGNRNWAPYLVDEVARMRGDGVRRALCFVTSAYSSYSGCRQYREDLTAALAELGDAGGVDLVLDRTRVYFNHPAYVDTMVDAVVAALAELPDEVRTDAEIAFVTHSVPDSMNASSGPTGEAYVAQHRSVASRVAAGVAEATGTAHDQSLVFCSRSGPPTVPWLEPDVNDHLRARADAGARAVVLAPIGFVSDHMEVIYDLDTEAMATARELGLPCTRAATAGVEPRFVAMVRELLLERAAAERGEDPSRPAVGDLPPAWDRCAPDCCANARSQREALVGAASSIEDIGAPLP